MKCNLCPRGCNADRGAGKGVCGTDGAVLSRVGTHVWEEPCISGSRGSGTIFFAGCNLKCRFCQNYDVTVRPHGSKVDARRLADVILYVASSGVHNVNLVTAAHVSDVVAQALSLCKHRLKVPVVYNTSSYESVRALKNLEGLVDVYLPDLKFCSAKLSADMCNAADYFSVATAAIEEMRRQQPQNVYAEGILQRGVLVRHLVLPNMTEDTKRVLDWIAAFDKTLPVSLMAQYFPARRDDKFPFLNRRLYSHEYRNAVEYFFNVGLTQGYTQEAQSATKDYVPDFSDAEMAALLDKIPREF